MLQGKNDFVSMIVFLNHHALLEGLFRVCSFTFETLHMAKISSLEDWEGRNFWVVAQRRCLCMVQLRNRISLKKRSSIIQNGDLSAGCETFFHLLEEDRIEKIVIAFKT